MIIGRTFEKEKLIKAYESEYSQFVTVYGRRRVGKTFFVRETFDYTFTFEHAGLAKSSMKMQLKAWQSSLKSASKRNMTVNILKKVRLPVRQVRPRSAPAFLPTALLSALRLQEIPRSPSLFTAKRPPAARKWPRLPKPCWTSTLRSAPSAMWIFSKTN